MTTTLRAHPADLLDTYLSVCSNESRFVAQALEAFEAASTGGPVLDCAVGTGFGTTRLLSEGHPIVCSDGSPEMLQRFEANCRREGLTNKAVIARWDQLGDLFPAVFALVMCRGNSLAYADAWDEDTPRVAGGPRIASHLAGMTAAIRPGGALLLDIPRIDADAEPMLRLDHHGTSHDGLPARIVESVLTDLERSIRRWTVEMTVGDLTHVFERSSRLLDRDRIVALLCGLGFDDVVSLAGDGIRDHYESLLALRLDSR